MRKLTLLIFLLPSVAMALSKSFIVKTSLSPAKYRIVTYEVSDGGPPIPEPPNYVTDAPTDPVQLQALLDAQAQTDSLTVVPDPLKPGKFKGAIDTAKQATRQAEINAQATEETRKENVRKARAVQVKALAQKVKNKTATLAEKDAALEALILDFAKDLD